MILPSDFTIIDAPEIKEELNELLQSKNIIELDFSQINSIDLSGLQLFISFIKEAKLKEKEVRCFGEFNNEFSECISSITFSQTDLVNGVDLQQFILDTI